MSPKILSRSDLRRRADDLNLTHGEIAERIGLKRSAVSNTLSNHRGHPGTRAAIAGVLRVDPQLIDWSAE